MQLTHLTAALAAIATAHAIDASATPSSSGAVPSPTPDSILVDTSMLPTTSGQILLDYDQNCYLEFNDIQGCSGRSQPFGTVNKATGNCNRNGTNPLTANICGGQVWLYTHGTPNEKTFIPPLGEGDFVFEGKFYFKNSTGHANRMPYNMGYIKPGCKFQAKIIDGYEYTWTGSCYPFETFV